MRSLVKILIVALATLSGGLILNSQTDSASAATTCEVAFEIPVVDQNGTAISGEVTGAYIIHKASWGGYDSYSIDASTATIGKINICKFSDDQINLYRLDTMPFNAGDQLKVTFAPQGNPVIQSISHTFSFDQAEKFNAGTKIDFPAHISLSTSQTNFAGTNNGIAAGEASWDLLEISASNPSGNSIYLANGISGSDGKVKISGLQDANYELSIYPIETSDPFALPAKVQFSVVSGRVVDVVGANDQGAAEFPKGNVRLTFTSSPSISAEDAAQFYVTDSTWQHTFIYRGGTSFVADLPAGKKHMLNFDGSPEAGYSLESQAPLEITVDSNGTKIEQNVSLLPPNIAFQLQTLDNQQLTYSSIYLVSKSICPNFKTFDNSCLVDAEVNSYTGFKGTAKFNFMGSGDYYLIAKFDQSSSSGSATTIFNLSFNNGAPTGTLPSGLVEVTPSTIKTYKLTLQRGNFNALVTDRDGTPLQGGRVTVYPEAPGSFNELFSPNVSIAKNGKFSLNLIQPASGSFDYNVRVEPSIKDSKNNAMVNYTVRITSEGILTVTQQPYVGPPNVAPTDSVFQLKLPRPNFYGSIFKPGSTTEKVSFADVLLTESYVDGGEISYYYGNQIYIPGNEVGGFSGFVPSGQYQVKVNAPWGATGLASNTYQVLVDADGDACLLPETGTTCSSTGSPFSFNLSTPNLSGEILDKDGAAVRNDVNVWLDASLWRWNIQDNFWQYDSWIQVDLNGKYFLNVQEEGIFKIKVSPFNIPGNSFGTFAFKSSLVGGVYKLCTLSLNINVADSTCTNVPSVALIQNVSLQAANLDLTVSTPEGFAGNLYTNLFTLVDDGIWESTVYEGFIPLTGNSTSLKGEAFLDLSTAPVHYKIMFESFSYDSSRPLARKTVDLYFGNFDGSAGNEFCVGSSTSCDLNAPSTDTIITPVGGKYIVPVSLSYGNLAGQVFEPDSAKTVANANLNVQKWEITHWSNGNYVWNYQHDGWASANRDGAFSLNLDKSGFYKLDVNQPWLGELPYAPSSYIVEVSGNSGNPWCIHNLSIIPSYQTYSKPNNVANCGNYGFTNGLAGEGLKLNLATPKISGEVLLPVAAGETQAKPAKDSWVDLLKLSSTGSYYEYVSSTTTNSDGKYYLNPNFDTTKANNFKVEVHPSWNNKVALTSFKSTQFCLGTGASCTASRVLNLTFPKPNINGVVNCATSLETSESCIRVNAVHTYVQVEQKTASNPWSWTDLGSPASRNGNFSLVLPEGTADAKKQFKITLFPHNATLQGAKAVYELDLWRDGETTNCDLRLGATTISGCDPSNLKLKLTSPNLNGQLTFGQTENLSEASRKGMSYSIIYISKFSSGTYSFYTDTYANKKGEFSAALEDGRYQVSAWGNSELSSRSNVSFFVNVKTNVETKETIVTWSTADTTDKTIDLVNATAPILDFDRKLPNVVIKLPTTWLSKRTVLITETTSAEPRRVVVGTGLSAIKVDLTKDKTYSFNVIADSNETLGADCSRTNLAVNKSVDEVNANPASQLTVDLSACTITRTP